MHRFPRARHNVLANLSGIARQQITNLVVFPKLGKGGPVWMSLVIAMKAADGIVMAADTRGTIGDPRGLTAINDNYQKIFSLGHCGIGFAGTSEMGNALLDELRKKGLDNFNGDYILHAGPPTSWVNSLASTLLQVYNPPL
jgi:20S proteasome alpha/beta subunit